MIIHWLFKHILSTWKWQRVPIISWITILGGGAETGRQIQNWVFHKGNVRHLFVVVMLVLLGWGRRRQWHPTPVLLPGKSHGQRSLVGCSPWGRWGLDTTKRLHFPFSLSCIGEGNGNPLQCSCLENPRDGGAWWAAVSGVTQSQTRLKWLSSSSRVLEKSSWGSDDELSIEGNVDIVQVQESWRTFRVERIACSRALR